MALKDLPHVAVVDDCQLRVEATARVDCILEVHFVAPSEVTVVSVALQLEAWTRRGAARSEA